jgi:hypothetical protein
MLDRLATRRLQLDVMHERETQSSERAERTASSGARTPADPRSRALALQRAAGNRAARRVLSRWVKHPDPEQKGVMVPDSTAEEFTRFNPPKNE